MIAEVVVSGITLFSTKMDEAAEFYNAIGLDLNKSVHGWGPDYHYLDVLMHNGRKTFFEIYQLQPGSSVSPEGLRFDVENLAKVFRKLTELKAPLLRPLILKKRPELCRSCMIMAFKDPDGRTVTIHQM